MRWLLLVALAACASPTMPQAPRRDTSVDTIPRPCRDLWCAGQRDTIGIPRKVSKP